MMNDYSAASPRIFPHTCSLCNVECVQIKDWIEHQNTSIHIESCRRLRKQYPDWNVETVSVSRNERKPPLDHRSPKRRTRSPSRSQSWSRSPSPWHHHGRSRSRGRRQRSRSRSPRRYPPVPKPVPFTSPPYTPPAPASTPSSVPQPASPPRRISPRQISPRRQQRSSSSERLAKKLIQSSGLSVTDNTTLEAMMESLAPALMAELAKKKSSSSSVSTKSTSKKQTSPPTPFRKTALSKPGSSKNLRVKNKGLSGTSCSLRLKGVPFSTSYQEVVHAVEAYGKISHAILHKASEEALVRMEREEDAKALAECRNLMIRGRIINVFVEKDVTRDHKVNSVISKKKEVPSAKLPPSTKGKVPAKKTDRNVVKKVVKKQDLCKKCVVQISGLPESGYTEEDLKNLAKPFGVSSGLIIAVQQRLAFVEMPDLDSVNAMLKTYEESPAKIQDSQLGFEQMTRPIDFSSPESLFRVVMGIEKPEVLEAANLWDRLLTVSNVPVGTSPATEVKELVKRFGSFKQALVLNHKIILEMDTPAIAQAVYNRFQKFPCIVQNNPLTFSVITKPVKASEEVKKKPEVKSARPVSKPGDAAKKGPVAPKTIAAGSKGTPTIPKTTAAAIKAKTSKTPTATKARKPAAASTAAAPKIVAPTPTAPPALTPATSAEKESPAKPDTPLPEGAVMSAENQKAEATDNQKSELGEPTGDQGTAEVSPLETKEGHGALPSNDGPEPAEGDVTDSDMVEDMGVKAAEVDSKQGSEKGDGTSATEAEQADGGKQNQATNQDCEPTAAAKPDDGKPAATKDAVLAPLGPDQKQLDFPPVTQEILRALEAAVHECRMRSSLRRNEEAKHAEAAKDTPPSPQRDPSHKHRGHAQSEEELPPVTHRGGSSGSSSGSRKSRQDRSPAPRGGKGYEGEVDKHKSSSSSRTSKSLNDSKAAGAETADEDFAEDNFPFNLDEFVTVDEVGDEAEGPIQEEETKTSEPLPHTTPAPKHPGTRRRTRNRAKVAAASPPAKTQKKPATQKPQKKQVPPAKAKKVPPKSVGTTEGEEPRDEEEPKNREEPQAAAEGAGEEIVEMEAETLKMEVEKVEEEKGEPPVASDPQQGVDVEGSAPESAAKVEGTEAATDTSKAPEMIATGTESQPEDKTEEGKPAVEKDESKSETTAPSIPAAENSQDPSAEQSPPKETGDQAPEEQTLVKKPEPGVKSTEAGVKKTPQGLAAALVTLDEVSEEEEDYPDEDEEEELLMQQNEALVTVDEVGGDEDPFLQAVKDLQALVTLDEIVEEDEPSSEAFGLDDETGDTFNPEALLTLDEAQGDDDEEEEGVKIPSPEKSSGSPATPEAQLTLDETQGDEEEEGAKILSPEKSAGSPATHEALLTLDKAHGDDEEKEEEGVKIPSPEKSTGSPATHEGDEEKEEEGVKIPSPESKSTGSPSLQTGLLQSEFPLIPSAESGELVGSPGTEEEGRGLEELRKMNFVTVDEIGEEEEQQPQEEEGEDAEPEQSPAVKVGRPKKRGRQAAVRKSTRGRKSLPVKEEEEEKSAAAPSPVAPAESCSVVGPSGAESQDHASVPEPQPLKSDASEDVPDNKLLHTGQDPKSNGDKILPEDPQESHFTTNPRATVKEESKLRRDEDRKGEPDTKKCRSVSPSLTDYKMPPFSPNSPIGLEFVVPKTGFFCKLCSLFYGNEDAAKKTHCSGLKHYQNMEKYFQKLKAGSTHSSVSE
ncbi:hypothetical protein SKAU_G00029310 [Synaphobranchus kaupii]|uniref:Matrin-type domain-containing protein n=1 Tax=Synaphobranchus kaupii TaxID=118154 RepID=A0A9Q1JDX6_SYNKA|nr:hypothetical protein SKAU_G00029310 [Synaphobranchus kaupii]